jgi:hypothetical protein
MESDILRLLRKTGYSKSEVETLPENFAERKPEDGLTYWYYSGPLDGKTRAFCRLMLKIDKVFSDEQIAKISEELGYDVLEYMGAYNCRHTWIRFRGKLILTPNPTIREIRKLINDGVEVSR